jgi:hypothetical protein
VSVFCRGVQAWCCADKGEATIVNTHDYPHLGIGTAVPYGAYDIARNAGTTKICVILRDKQNPFDFNLLQHV